MPFWPLASPGPPFDFERAAEASAALRSTADLLDRQTDQRVRSAASAQSNWQGGTREMFDRELAVTTRRAADLVVALQAAARRIDAAADEARRLERLVAHGSPQAR